MNRGAVAIVVSVFLLAQLSCGRPATLPAPPAAKKKTPPPPSPARIEGAWQTYHGAPQMRGYVPEPIAPPLEVAWRFNGGDEVPHPPVVAQGRIFAATVGGDVFALDGQGGEVWKRRLNAGTRSDGSPRPALLDAPLAIFDGRLFAMDGDGWIYALDPESGELLWKKELDVPVLGSPNWAPHALDGTAPGTLYVIGQDEGTLHAIDPATGGVHWVSEPVSRCDGSPGVGANTVTFGSCDSALHVFDARTGKLKHNLPLGGDAQVASGVAMEEDTAYTGCRSGTVFCIDAAKGAIVWQTQLSELEIFTTPAVSPDWVVVGGEDAYLYALDKASGNLAWKREMADTPSSAVIAGDRVVVTADGALHVLALKDGAVLWSAPVGDYLSGPAVVDGLVLVGSDDGVVTAFRSTHGAERNKS